MSERTGSVDVGFHKDVYTSHAVQDHFFVFVQAPITHPGQVRTASIILFVALSQHGVLVETGSQSKSLIGLDPRIIVDWRYVRKLSRDEQGVWVYPHIFLQYPDRPDIGGTKYLI